MIQEIQNYMKFASITANDFRARPCFAHVLNVNTQNYTAQVALQPSGQTTPFLPILSHWVGNGWGMYSPRRLETKSLFISLKMILLADL